jgi:UDP-glucose 4-epimerase
MLQGKQPTIFGDGEQSRDFTYIDNVVDANLRACTAPAAQVAGGVFNVGTGERATLNEVFRLLQDLADFSQDPIYGPERSGDIKHSLADISLAKRCLGYEPKVTLRQGLRQTLDWYKEQMRAAATH